MFRVTRKHCPRSMDPPTDLVHAPWTTVQTGPQNPPLRTPHEKTIIKMTIRDLTYHLFFVSWWQILIVTLCKYCCGDKRRTYVLTTQLTSVFPSAFATTDCLCYFIRLIRHVFIDLSQVSQNSAPLTKKDADVHWRQQCPSFYLTVMCLAVESFSRVTLFGLIEEGKYRRQNNPGHSQPCKDRRFEAYYCASD